MRLVSRVGSERAGLSTKRLRWKKKRRESDKYKRKKKYPQAHVPVGGLCLEDVIGSPQQKPHTKKKSVGNEVPAKKCRATSQKMGNGQGGKEVKKSKGRDHRPFI